MKRTFISISVVICLIPLCRAQYSLNKTMYDYRSYSYETGDPYNPPAMALSSILVPGLGQILEGEGFTGFCFLGGSVAMAVIKRMSRRWFESDLSTLDVVRKSVLSGQAGIRIWSGINASRIAKVSNLAFREKYKTGGGITISPCLIYGPKLNPYLKISYGITFNVAF